MAIAHFLMQGKGGVGKSLVAALLFQYLQERGFSVFGCDTDPINNTFAGYKEFEIITLDLMDGDDIDPQKFDRLIDNVCGLSPEDHIVIDSGSSSYVSLCSYVKGSGAFNVLTGEGHTVLLHSVVTGGQAMQDTLSNIDSLITNFPFPIVAWLNPINGEIQLNGHGFLGFTVYTKSPDRFKAVIELPKLKAETFGRDFTDILTRRWSFKQGISSKLPIMTRSRLVSTWQKMQTAIEGSCLIDKPCLI